MITVRYDFRLTHPTIPTIPNLIQDPKLHSLNLHPSSPLTEIFQQRTNLKAIGSTQNNDNFQKSSRYFVGSRTEVLSFSERRRTKSNFESCGKKLRTTCHRTNHFLN